MTRRTALLLAAMLIGVGVVLVGLVAVPHGLANIPWLFGGFGLLVAAGVLIGRTVRR